MEIVFPSLESNQFIQAFDQVGVLLGELEQEFDSRVPTPDTGLTAESLEAILATYEALGNLLRTVNAYIYAFTTTDSKDELAMGRQSEIDSNLVRLRKFGKRFSAAVGISDLDALFAESEVARNHSYALLKAKQTAEHLMAPGEEMLASELEITAYSAWSRLHSNMTSQLKVEVVLDGESESLPMSVVRGLAYDADRERRKAAHSAELAGWKTVEVPLSAAMNSIKATVNMLSTRRGWVDPLEESLFSSNIDRKTLEAMMTAATEAFPIFRRYLKAKAKAIGVEKLAFYDIFAPLSASTEPWEYDRACQFIVEQFGSYSEKLGKFAMRAFSENWVDAEPREGKVDGAYCMSIRGDESRILENYKPNFDSVSTLAHELGHAYHNLCLADRTVMQRSTPMTVAETASIFCETIIRKAVLKSGSDQEKLVVLEASLQGACQVVVDISSRYLFEKGVFERRQKRELSAREMCDLMIQAQLDTYGDGLDPEELHPYMWAVKSHYYGRSFYNYPYMFGLLFALGLYAVYQKDPEPFVANYDDLLSSTGLADAATLGARFGIDITTPDFWRASLDQIKDDVELFESLVESI